MLAGVSREKRIYGRRYHLTRWVKSMCKKVALLLLYNTAIVVSQYSCLRIYLSIATTTNDSAALCCISSSRSTLQQEYSVLPIYIQYFSKDQCLEGAVVIVIRRQPELEHIPSQTEPGAWVQGGRICRQGHGRAVVAIRSKLRGAPSWWMSRR